MCPVALTGSIENFPDGSSNLMVNIELIPVSVSLISMLRLASGVPKGTFSWIVTLYSCLLKVGGSSLTSRIVMVTSAVVLVLGSSPKIGHFLSVFVWFSLGILELRVEKDKHKTCLFKIEVLFENC